VKNFFVRLGFGLLVVMIVDLSLRFNWLGAVLGLVLAGNVPSHSVVAGERTTTEWTRHTYPLMALTNVSAQVGFIPVKSLAERTFEFLTCGPTDTVTCRQTLPSGKSASL
jgi:hypothetical protein